MELPDNMEAHPHWNVANLRLGSSHIHPTYASHLAQGVKFEHVEEITSATGSHYPHFHAPLSPQRNFLHYIMSSLVCNAEIPNKEYLFAQTERIFNAHVEEFTARYERAQGEIMQEKDRVGDLARAFTAKKRFPRAPNVEVPPQYEAFFEETFKKIKVHFSQRQHNHYHTPDALFAAACEHENLRWNNDQFAKNAAHNLIGREIADGRLTKLAEHDVEHRHNVAIAGVVGAGKSVFYDTLKLRREDHAFVDLDEFKECKLLVDRTQDDPSHPPSWNKRTHDECHLIRRKIIDELMEKARTGKAPSLLLMASQLSPRVLELLTYDNAKTNSYLFYCDPDRALKNTMHRHLAGGRRMSTESVLKSAQNLSDSVRGLLPYTITSVGPEAVQSRMFLEMKDSTRARTEGNGVTTVFSADAHNGLHMYDIDRFIQSLDGDSINLKATSPDEAYHKRERREVIEQAANLLLPHRVTFYSKDKTPYALKEAETTDIRGFAERAQPDAILDESLVALDPNYATRQPVARAK